MVLIDILSRQNHNDSNPHEVISISFIMHNALNEKYYNIGKQNNFGYKHDLKPNLVELNFQKFMV